MMCLYREIHCIAAFIGSQRNLIIILGMGNIGYILFFLRENILSEGCEASMPIETEYLPN